MAEGLEIEGWQVALAHSAEEGIEACARTTCGVILLDIGPPGMSGSECLSRIGTASPATNCFLLTGYGAACVAQQGIDAGAVAILTKPVDIPELLGRLNALSDHVESASARSPPAPGATRSARSRPVLVFGGGWREPDG